MTQEAAAGSDSRPAFPAWLIPGLLVYSITAIALIGSSLSIKIVENDNGRIVADSWTTTLAFDLLVGNLDPGDASSIAGSIATSFLQLAFGCLIGLITIGLVARKRGSSTASYLINQFQLVAGLAFFYYYLQDKEVSYLWFGGLLTVSALLQYWVLSRPAVRRWLRSYAVEFISIPSSESKIKTFLRNASIRKGISSLVLGFQVFVLAFTAYALVGELASWALLRSDNSLGNLIVQLIQPLMILYLLVFPVVVLYPTLAVVAVFWRRPPRILLLRPFHAPAVSNTLKDIVRDSIGYFAHVYTLSDTDIRQRWYIKWPIALPQMWLLHFRAGRLRNARSLARMQRRVRRTIARNINWLASAGKLFSVSATETMWKPCVSGLMSVVDAVLFDISNQSEGIGWELDQITRQSRVNHVVFVARKSEFKQALEFLKLQGVNAEVGVNVFAYDEEGMALVDQFTKRFAFLLTSERPQLG